MPPNYNLFDLPSEILLHIFNYIYVPWHLEIKVRQNVLVERYFDKPQVRAIPAPPPIAPLLVSRRLNELVTPTILASFTGTINAFEKTGFQRLPDPWYTFAPKIRKLCVPNNIGTWLWDTAFINSLPELELVEFFEEFGVLRCSLGNYPFNDLLEYSTASKGEDQGCPPAPPPCPAKLKQLLIDDKFDEYWIFRSEPYIPSKHPPANPKQPHWLGNFIARRIRTIVHHVFTFHIPDPTLIPEVPDPDTFPPGDGFYWSKYKLGNGVVEDLDVALAGCNEELTVVGKRWTKSLRAEDRVL